MAVTRMGFRSTGVRNVLSAVACALASAAMASCADPAGVSTEAITDPRCPSGMTVLVGTSGPDTINGSNAAECILGLGGNDVLNGNGGGDVILGGEGDDTLDGGNQADTLYGDEGNDDLAGGNQDDTLFGGAGDDQLHGDNGKDELRGEAGADYLCCSQAHWCGSAGGWDRHQQRMPIGQL